jgi:CHAT domain-containing protein
VQRLIAPREALLEYVIGDEASYCLAISRARVNVFPLPTRRSLDALVDRYLSAIKKEKDARPEGRALYSAVLKPILTEFPEPVLIIVPDGSLHRIPFAGLADEHDRYLLESRTISYSPSGTVFALLRSRGSVPPRELLAVGNVDYGGGIASIATSVLFRGVQKVRLGGLPNLPGTGDEVEAVQSALKELHGPVLSHAAATETNFKRDASKPLTVIHLAVHALADSKYPDRAALVLAPDRAAGEDGLLQVRGIRTLPISGTRLVTLSACDTSVGRTDGEEGVSSIVYAFLYAGARSAVATYWKVEDTATTDLMTAFYTGLGRGKSKAEALRDAQLQLVHSQTDLSRPFFWAAFNLMGDGSDSI